MDVLSNPPPRSSLTAVSGVAMRNGLPMSLVMPVVVTANRPTAS
ncbi:MAG: hypothetical protein OXH90_09405 [Paracoccaceae bacterium]|nr:hypothetical protein [Paracoccaceae bacterium]MDE2915892.1 hypothetical protein [Paracoccaceae bacterium]